VPRGLDRFAAASFASGLTLFLGLALLAACSSPRKESRPVLERGIDWSIAVRRWKAEETLKGSIDQAGYDGSLSRRPVERKAPAGEIYLCVELAAERKGGEAGFAWKDIFIEDETGKRYPRMSDDRFLELFGMGRLPSVDLSFGEAAGWICFELPLRAARGRVSLLRLLPGGGRDTIALE
jgi:hypothetical protein